MANDRRCNAGGFARPFCSAALLVLLITTLAACMRLHECRVNVAAGEPPDFGGIRQLAENTERLNVLLIHGMRGYAGNDAKEIPALIAGALGFGEGKSNYFYIKDTNEQTVGCVHRIFYTKTPDQNSKLKFVAVYILDWTYSTFFDKYQLIEDDDQEWIAALRLEGYTNLAKRDLMDDSLADAILYTGKRRKRIDHVFNETVGEINRDSSGSAHRNVIISFSLGSIITARGLSELSYPLGPAEKTFNSHVCKVYFLANQIPLLALGIEENASAIKHVYQSFAETREKTSLCDSTGGPWVVSVSDPNDLLSYPVPEYILREHPNTFADVGLSVADKAYWVPFTKYWVPNPIAAHTDYGSNKKVRELLLEGYKPKTPAGPC